jgi:hypothetical protein
LSNFKKGGGPRNPFDTYDQLYKPEVQRPMQPFSASKTSGPADQQRREEISYRQPTPIALPPHLYIPEDAQSVDIRRLANVPPATTVTLLRFVGVRGAITRFINYGVFFDALMFDLINLVPLVDGVRVFPFHGDPQSQFKIGLGTGADLSNSNMIQCLLDLQPNQVIEWIFTNNDVVDVAAGVRMVGYVDQSTIRKTGRFGG